jgi:hypothetical protein
LVLNKFTRLFAFYKQAINKENGLGSIADDGMDHILIATVYFLAPAIKPTAKFDELNGTVPYCTSFVKHYTFWNLGHIAKNTMPLNLPPFGIDPATAFFVGRYTSFTATNAALEAEQSKIINDLFNATDKSGFFFTQ